MGLGKGLALSAIVVARVTEFRPCRSSRASHERVPPVSRTGFKPIAGGRGRGAPLRAQAVPRDKCLSAEHEVGLAADRPRA